MSTHNPSKVIRQGVNRSRWARNGRIPEAQLYRRVARDFNHVLAYRRKEAGGYCTNAQAIPVGVMGTTNRWHFYVQTGEGADRLECRVLQAKPDNASAVDPYVDFTADDGGGAVTSTAMRHPAIDAAPSDVPDEWSVGVASVAVSSNTTYEVVLRAVDFARPVSVTFYERGLVPVDTTKGGCDPGYSARGPIKDADIQQLLEAGTNLWKHNRGYLWTWTRDVTSPTFTTGTPTNVLDSSSTSVSSSTPGATIDLTNHDTVGGDVPVVFAVRGERTSGSNNGVVSLTDSGGALLTINNITTDGWYTVSGTLTGASHKVDVLASIDISPSTLRVDAFALYLWET